MALIIGTLAEYVATGLAAYRSRPRFARKRLDPESGLGAIARATAMQILGFSKAAYDADQDAVPGPGNSDSAADNWAFSLGVPSNNPNTSYGRNIALTAAGGAGVPTGVAGTLIAAGSTLVDPTGQVTLTTTDAITLGGPPNTEILYLSAVTPGSAGNLPIGTIVTFQPAIPNVTDTFALTVALAGGAEVESTADLTARTLERTQSPPRGGTAADFRFWAEDWRLDGIVQTNVARAYVYPLRGGNGTVHIVITAYGSGEARYLAGVIGLVPIVTRIGAYVGSVRPVGTQSTVMLPNLVSCGGIRVSAQASQGRYQYDWFDFGQPLLVVAVGGATSITVDANVATDPRYATLKAAIDLGKKPRLQIGAQTSVLPLEARASAYTNAANSVITLAEAPTATLTVGDWIWASGPIVLPAARAILEYIDGIGTSKQSGYADAADTGDIIVMNGAKIIRAWDDTIRIAELERIALDVLDPTDNRTRMVVDRSASAKVNGASVNRQATDGGFATPPNLWFVPPGGPTGGILITHA